jgi:cobalt-zinc-cadmium efflux system membrane fusion protein
VTGYGRASALTLPLLAAILTGAAGCRMAPQDAAPAATPVATVPRDVVALDAAARRRAGIVVAPARRVTRGEAAEAPGLVALNETRTARIGSLAEGIVVDVLVQPGMRVSPGQLLASLHSHAVHDAWAGYRRAKADERRLVTERRYATEAEARAGRLYKDKAVSLQDLQRAEANRMAADELLDMGRAELKRSEEELEHLGVTNGEDPSAQSGEQIPIRTPFAGVVLERLVTQGTAVTPGTPMFVVSDLSTLWVLAEIDEAHLAQAQIGRPATVRVAAYPQDAFAATVTYIDATVNPKTRRITVRCETPNPDGRLKPQMYATVEIGEANPQPVVAVPASAVQTVNGQPSVFVAEADSRFRVRPIEPGAERDGLVEIRRGLQEGEQVVTAGAFVLKSELLAGDAGSGQ